MTLRSLRSFEWITLNVPMGDVDSTDLAADDLADAQARGLVMRCKEPLSGSTAGKWRMLVVSASSPGIQSLSGGRARWAFLSPCPFLTQPLPVRAAAKE